MNIRNHKIKLIVILLVIFNLSFFILLFSFRIIPLSEVEDESSFDIRKEIDALNEEQQENLMVKNLIVMFF